MSVFTTSGYGQFYYGPNGFIYKKSYGAGARRTTLFSAGGNAICNKPQNVNNKYKPGGSGVGASSISNRRARNRLATVYSGNSCFPCYNTRGQYSSYTHNPNGFFPCYYNSNDLLSLPFQPILYIQNIASSSDGGVKYTLNSVTQIILFNQSLTIFAGQTFIIPYGYTLIIYGTLNNNGTLINNGKINNNSSNTFNNFGYTENNGQFANNSNGTVFNEGSFVNKGSLENKNTLINNGSITNNSNSTFNNSGNVQNNGNVTNEFNTIYIESGTFLGYEIIFLDPIIIDFGSFENDI